MVNLDKKTAIAKFRELDTKIDNIEGGGSAATWATLEGKPSTFPPATHNHDDRYYQKSEVDGLIPDVPAAPTWSTLSGKPATFPPAEHNHDAQYAVKSLETQVSTLEGELVTLQNNYDALLSRVEALEA